MILEVTLTQPIPDNLPPEMVEEIAAEITKRVIAAAQTPIEIDDPRVPQEGTFDIGQGEVQVSKVY